MPDPGSNNVGELRKEYERLATERAPYLTRAQTAAALTIPALFTLVASGGDLSDRRQALGAECVNGLTARLLLALFPPNAPFFRFVISAEAERTIREQTKDQSGQPDPVLGDAIRADIDAQLSVVENKMMKEFAVRVPRHELHQAIRLAVVTGMVLLWDDPRSGLRAFPLDRFVCQRAGDKFRCIILKAATPIPDLPVGVRERAEQLRKADSAVGDPGERGTGSGLVERGDVDLYTRQELQPDGRYKITQELSDGTPVMLPGADGLKPGDEPPLIVVPINLLPNENYARGIVEEYIGDFATYDGLSHAAVTGAAAASRLLFGCPPNAIFDPKDASETPNGGFITARRDDVFAIQADKHLDLADLAQIAGNIESRLRRAFISNFAAQRQGERVTAEEIRMLARELEIQLGGIYSTLTASLQRPILDRLLKRLQNDKVIGKIRNVAEPVIVTGAEALGRTADLQRINEFFASIPQPMLATVAPYIDAGKLLTAVASAAGVNGRGFIKNEVQMEKERLAAQRAQQQQQMMEVAKSAAGPAVTALSRTQPPLPEQPGPTQETPQ